MAPSPHGRLAQENLPVAKQPPLDLRDIEQFLYREARLIDERRFDEWLSLYTDDAIYWVPANRNDANPKREVSLIYDTRNRMAERVFRITSGLGHAQDPPSRTRHLISNVELLEGKKDEVTVSSYLALYELRRGKQNNFAARLEHRLRRVDGDWRIALRKVELLNNNEVIDNLTFIV